ncbi:type IV pilus biogenesis protein PilM, partial [Chryseobacterium sp. SIMBA_038]
MPLLIVLLMFLAFATEYEESVWTRAQNARVSQEANVVGDSMRVYRTYVQQYSTANPSYTGQVPDSVLPTWYVRPTSV